jgi:hypothetical protein
LPVQLSLHRHDRRLRLGDHDIQCRDLLAQSIHGQAVGVRAVMKLLDLTLGRQDAPRLGARSPLDDLRTAKHVPVIGGDGASRGS